MAILFRNKENSTTLLSRLQAGNRSAQKEVYEQYFGAMVGVAMRYVRTKEDAYEVLNEAFLQVFKSIKSFNEKGSLKAWISRIVFHTAIDHVRKNLKYQEMNLVSNEEHQISVNNDALQKMNLNEIYKCIQLLPENTRAVFSLYVIDGYKHKEISKMLSISEGTSKWHLSNARKNLQKMLNKITNV
ncbi:MAG: RNA polymerase sigma factor [Saprospiraceae bacterium]|nr:RNA polymerase sigma factor [Saprospiraceae bacterium]